MTASDDEKRGILHNASSQKPAAYTKTVSQGRETLTIAILLFAQLMVGSTSYLPTPFLTYEGKQRGLTETLVGIIIGAHEVSRLITAPLCDTIMNRLRPKWTLILGFFLCGLSTILFGLTGYTRDWTMFILCVICKIISGAAAALANVAISSIVMKSKSYSTTKLFGWFDMAVVLGLVGGYTIGRLLYKALKYVMTFVAVGIFLITWTFPLWLVTPDITIAEMGLVSTDTMLSDWVINTYSISVDNVSFVYISWPIMYALTTPVAVWTTEKGWRYSPIIISFLWLSVAYFILCPSPILQQILPPQYKNKICKHDESTMMIYILSPLWMIIALLGSMGVAVSSMYIAIFQIALESVIHKGFDGESMHTFAKLSAMFYSGLSCGSVCGPPLSGIITQTLGYPWNQTIIACLTAAMLAIFSVYACITEWRSHVSKPLDEEDNSQKPLLLNDVLQAIEINKKPSDTMSDLQDSSNAPKQSVLLD